MIRKHEPPREAKPPHSPQTVIPSGAEGPCVSNLRQHIGNQQRENEAPRKRWVALEGFRKRESSLSEALDYPLRTCHALTGNGTRGITSESGTAGLGEGVG
jgi:hypothetical protein